LEDKEVPSALKSCWKIIMSFECKNHQEFRMKGEKFYFWNEKAREAPVEI